MYLRLPFKSLHHFYVVFTRGSAHKILVEGNIVVDMLLTMKEFNFMSGKNILCRAGRILKLP